MSPAWAPPWSQPGERAWVPQPGNMGLPLFGSTTRRRWWSGWLQCVSGSSGRWAERVCLYHLAACMLFFPSRQERCFLVPSHCGLSPDVYTYVPNDSSGAFLELLGAVLWGYLTSEASKLTRRTKVRIGGVWEITQLVYVYFFDYVLWGILREVLRWSAIRRRVTLCFREMVSKSTQVGFGL